MIRRRQVGERLPGGQVGGGFQSEAAAERAAEGERDVAVGLARDGGELNRRREVFHAGVVEERAWQSHIYVIPRPCPFGTIAISLMRIGYEIFAAYWLYHCAHFFRWMQKLGRELLS